MFKRILSLFLTVTICICYSNINVGFAENTESLDNVITESDGTQNFEEVNNLEESAAPEISPGQIQVEENATADESRESLQTEDIGLSADGSYDIAQLPNGKYAAVNIEMRDLEVYVTDGSIPISDAKVTVGNKTLTTDENGKVLFEDLSTSSDKYTIYVSSEEYGERSSDVLLTDIEVLEDNIQEFNSTKKYAVSYWLPNQVMSVNEYEENNTASVSATGASISNGWKYNTNSGLTEGGPMWEYNGLLYVSGDYMRLYNPMTGLWTILTGEGVFNDDAVFCNGKIYSYSVLWHADGDDYWRASYTFKYYDIISNTYSVISSGDRGGKLYASAIACNGAIYYAGGGEVVFDMDDEEPYYGIDIYDAEGTVASCDDLPNGGSHTAVLCEEQGEYYNNIFYFFPDGNVSRLNTLTGKIETKMSDEYFTYHEGESASVINGKIYFIGGDGAERSVRIYDIAQNTWENGSSMEEERVNHSVQVCNGRIYVLGGDSSGKTIEIYDTATDTWQYGISSNTSFVSSKSVMLNGIIYIMGENGTLCICKVGSYIRQSLIAIGTDHIVRVKDGVVQAKGDNTYGQLGTGDNNERDEFTDIIGPWGSKRICNVSTRGNTTYAISEDNILYAWGDNSKGQIGNGTTTNKNTPVQVMTNVSDVSAGLEHAVALSSDGGFYAWGSNENRQIDDESGTRYFSSPKYVIGSVTFAGSGAYQSFTDGSQNDGIFAMGKNDVGQLGNSNPYNSNMSSEVSPLNYAAGGLNHTGLLVGGRLYLCGDNTYGQIGTTLSDNAAYANYLVDTDIDIDNVYAGGNSTAYIKDGKVYQMGSMYSLLLSQFTNIENTNTIKNLSIGNDYAIGTNNGDKWLRWGLMGDRINDENEVNIYKIEYPYEIKDVDAYRNQTVAIDEVGQVIAWGEGYYADGTDKMTVKNYPTVIEGITNPKQVSRGKNHNLVLDASGDVWCWGSNSNYPMGSELGGKVKTAAKISSVSNVKQVAAGTEFSIFLKNDGTLWGVGKNDRGQLGQGNTTNTSTPVQITDKTDFQKVSVGEIYAAAIASDGVYTWGGNSLSQLGDGTTTDRYIPEKVNIKLGTNEYFTDVSAAINFCIALTNKGNAYIWGDNGSGEFGCNNTSAIRVPTKIWLSNIVSISGGKLHVLAVTSTGKVYSWGYCSGENDNRLGYKATKSVWTPGIVANLSSCNINKVVCGFDYSVALSKDGKLYTYGNNCANDIYSYKAEIVDSKIIDDVKWLNSYIESYSDPITESISLPTTAPNGSTITWTSGNTYYIANDGTLVSRPDCYGSDTDVRLYAAVSLGDTTYNPCYTVTVKQDPSIQPSTDIPVRMLGDENDQTTQISENVTPPNINYVSYKKVDGTDGTYILTVDCEYDDNAKPFYYWKSRQGTFLKVDGYDNYKKVQFTIDPDYIGQSVKVTVGMGDGLGYVDKVSVNIGETSVGVQSMQADNNIVALAMNEELNTTDINDYNINLAIGIDTSINMLNFDPGETKSWIDSVEGLIDSAGDSADMVLVTKDSFDYTNDTDSAKNSLSLIKTNEYIGSMDALSLLERCDEALKDEENISQTGNNIVVLFVQNIEDINALKAKIDELEANGTAVYIFNLSNGQDNINNENIIICENELKLRLNMSELYGAFADIGQLAAVSTYGIFNTSNYKSDYISSIHNISTNISFGSNIASVLNLYGCLPIIARKDNTTNYNLFEADNITNSDIYNLIVRDYSKMSSGVSTIISAFYNSLKSDYISNTNIVVNSNSGVTGVIDNNLKYRFPVVVIQGDASCIITAKNSTGYVTVGDEISFDDEYKIIDTYSYLLLIAGGTGLKDNVSESGQFYNEIQINKPTSYGTADITLQLYKNVNNGNSAELSVSSDNTKYIINNISDNQEYLVGIKTIYNDAVPNVYNSSKYYLVKKYTDLHTQNDTWYYEYLFKATNMGIINGDDGNNFNPDNSLTRAALLKMVIQAAGIPDCNVNSSDIDWAEEYINYFKNLHSDGKNSKFNKYTEQPNTVTQGGNETTNPFYYSDTVSREEAAYIIWTIYANSDSEDITVPSRLYEYDKNTSTHQNSNWKSDSYFIDINTVRSSVYESFMYQLYCNGVMVGSLDNGNLYYKPTENLTRAQACKIITLCLFEMDESVRQIQAVEESEKTVYIMLYDSEVASYSTETSGISRYRDDNDLSYQYSEEFFKNYLDMIGNKKVAFVISIRDVDFDATTTGYQTQVGDTEQSVIIPSYELTSTRMTNIIDKTSYKTIAIINNIKKGLDDANANRTEKIQMPEIYIGTPHTYTNESWINIWEQTNPNARQLFLDNYSYVSTSIYNSVVYSVGKENVTGIYYGREDPDAMYSDDGVTPSVSYQNASNISDFIHNKDKKLIWIPYSTNATEWYNIGMYANQGKSCNNTGYDLFDIVMMQPGIFYSNYNGTLTDIQNYDVTIQEGQKQDGQDIYNNQKRKIKDLRKSAEMNQVYMYDALVGEAPKGTDTTISFEIEYDISLVTGRVHNRRQMKPTDKANNFTITYNYYKDLIYDGSTSYAIYAGGPNEQNYDSLNAAYNDNVHCFINHPSYFGSEENGNNSDTGNGKAYSQFYELIQEETGNNGYYAEDYNNLIYDITKGLLYGGNFGSECKEYLGWN